jgi:hypothetical protein
MLEAQGTRVVPDMRALIVEASRSLAQLDSDRLEELALCCAELNREFAEGDAARRAEIAQSARDARQDFAVFARVLEATRANLKVMNRLRELRQGRRGYLEGRPFGSSETEAPYGNN